MGSRTLPIDAAIQSNLRETATRVLAFLMPREERVLRMRFGIGMNSDHTLEEVRKQFSLTRERIRQIEARALRELKHPSSLKDSKELPRKLTRPGKDRRRRRRKVFHSGSQRNPNEDRSETQPSSRRLRSRQARA